MEYRVATEVPLNRYRVSLKARVSLKNFFRNELAATLTCLHVLMFLGTSRCGIALCTCPYVAFLLRVLVAHLCCIDAVPRCFDRIKRFVQTSF